MAFPNGMDYKTFLPADVLWRCREERVQGEISDRSPKIFTDGSGKEMSALQSNDPALWAALQDERPS